MHCISVVVSPVLGGSPEHQCESLRDHMIWRKNNQLHFKVFGNIHFYSFFFKLSQFCTLHLSGSKCVMHREEAKLYDDHHPHFQNKMDLKQSPNLNGNVALQQNYLSKKYMNVV